MNFMCERGRKVKKVKEFFLTNYRLLIDVIIVAVIINFSEIIYGREMNYAVFLNIILVCFIIIDLIYLYLSMTDYLKKEFELNVALLGRHLHFCFYAFVLFVTGNKLYTINKITLFGKIDLSNSNNILWLLVFIILILVIAIFNFIIKNQRANTIKKYNSKTVNNNINDQEKEGEVEQTEATESKEYDFLKWIARGMVIIILSIFLVYIGNIIDLNEFYRYDRIISMVINFSLTLVMITILIIAIMIVCSIIIMAFHMIQDSVRLFKLNGKEKKDDKLSKNYLYLISAFLFIFIIIIVYQTIIVGGNLQKSIIDNFQKSSVYIMGVVLLSILLYFILTYFLVSLVVDKGENGLLTDVRKAVKEIGDWMLNYCKDLLKGPEKIIMLFSEMLQALCELIIDEDEADGDIKDGGSLDGKEKD